MDLFSPMRDPDCRRGHHGGGVMRVRNCPVCAHCGHTLNPHLEDDCEKYYLVGGEIYCKYCFGDYLRDAVEENPELLAELLGVPVVYVQE